MLSASDAVKLQVWLPSVDLCHIYFHVPIPRKQMLFNVCCPKIGIPIPTASLRSLRTVTGVLEMKVKWPIFPLKASSLKILPYLDDRLLRGVSGRRTL